MATWYDPLQEAFSTVDATYPHVECDRGRLRVEFQDWREQTVMLLFHDVAAFSWDDGDAAVCPSHRDDCSYIVRESPWVARHREVGTVAPLTDLQHFKLCFNTVGVLQVLSTRLEVVTKPSAATPDAR
jgi:hypothetical protein